MLCKALFLVSLISSIMSAPPAPGTHSLGKRQAPTNPCEDHPCGWIKYHDSNWNSYSAYDVIENTL